MRVSVNELTEKIVTDWKRSVVLDHGGEFLGFLSEIYRDWNGTARYFTIDSETDADDNLYPVDFIESIEGSKIILCEDFQEICGSKFYSLTKVLERDPYLTCDLVAA